MKYHRIIKAVMLCTPLLGVAHEEPDRESVFDLTAHVVTGTRTERILSETPIKTELIPEGSFNRFHTSSLKEALKLVPTARFENDCQNCGLNQIQLLGLSTEYTAVLFDGAPLYSGLAKVYGADLFPTIFIDRIEVVKGGSSVLYGPEAMAGVVNLLSREPDSSGGEVRFSLHSIKGDTTETESSFQGDWVGTAETFSLSAYGYYVKRDGLDLSTDGFTEMPEFENRVMGMQGWWHPTADGTLKLTYQYMDQAHRGGDQLDIPESQARVAESLAHEIHMAHIDWEQRVSSEFDYRLRASAMDIMRCSYYGARADSEQRAYDSAGNSGDVTSEFIQDNQALIDAIARNVWGLTENRVYFLDSQFNHGGSYHVISYGLQYRYEELEDGPLNSQSTLKTKDDFDNLGIFLQDQWEVTDKFELVSGLRLDRHDNVANDVLSPRLAARWFVTDNVTVRASWSTGFNAPGAFNEDKHIGVNNGGAIYLWNESGLEEESSQTWSFGVDYQPAGNQNQMILHSQIHYTELQNTFEIDDSGELSGDPNLWLRINGPDSRILVWENNLSWQLSDQWGLDSGLSYIYARYKDSIDRVTGLTTDEYIKRPEWTGHISLMYENDLFVDAYAMLNYTGSMIAVGEDADIWRNTPEFYVLDIGLSKTFQIFSGDSNLILAAGIENAFDDRQKDLQDNGEKRDPTYLYGPTQPFSVYFSVRILW